MFSPTTNVVQQYQQLLTLLTESKNGITSQQIMDKFSVIMNRKPYHYQNRSLVILVPQRQTRVRKYQVYQKHATSHQSEQLACKLKNGTAAGR